MEHTLRFKIKVVERTGVTILNQCSQASSWEGVKCGREGHITCNQGLEDLPKCTRSNVVYENICNSCIPDAAKMGHLPDQDCTAPPSLYVGETSRSIQERGQKHWGAARRKEDTSHMRRTQVLISGGQLPHHRPSQADKRGCLHQEERSKNIELMRRVQLLPYPKVGHRGGG